MGFPVGYSELLLPRLLINAAYLLGLIRATISWLLRCVGLQEFLESETSRPNSHIRPNPLQAISSGSVPISGIQEQIWVARSAMDAEECWEDGLICSVCLSEMRRGEEIRQLCDCRHMFHKGCVDKWVEYEHTTCPMCRSPFVLPVRADQHKYNGAMLCRVDPCSILTQNFSRVFS